MLFRSVHSIRLIVDFLHVYVIHVALLEWIGLSSICDLLIFRAFVGVMSCFTTLEIGNLTEIFLAFMLALAIVVLVVVAIVLVVALISSTMVPVSTIVVMAMILVTISTMVVSMFLETGAATMIVEVMLLMYWP